MYTYIWYRIFSHVRNNTTAMQQNKLKLNVSNRNPTLKTY